MKLKQFISIILLAVLFSCDGIHLTFTAVTDEGSDDPILKVQECGFYGTSSWGDIVMGPDVQGAALHWSGAWQFRLMDSRDGSVYSSDAIPDSAVKGQKLTLRCKKVKGGIVEGVEIFPEVTVIKNSSSRIWLKMDGERFFIFDK